MSFSGVLGKIQIGAFELGKIPATVSPISFICNSVTSFGVSADVTSNRFQCDSFTSVGFIGESHITFYVNCTTSATFNCIGLTNNSFICDSITSVEFDSASVDYPRFRVDSKTTVEFFVRGGQSPDCYYDNAQIIASTIRNYVF